MFTVLIGALIFGYFLTVTQTPQKVTELLTGLGLGPYGILALIMVMYLVLGCLMDAMAMIILTVPIIFPVIIHLGFDPIWFGVIIVMTVELGLIHPPVGMNVFVIKSVVKDVSFSTIFRGVIPFVVTDLIRLVILIAFPILALWLPQRMAGSLGRRASRWTSRQLSQTKYVFTITARIGEVTSAGEIGTGVRRIIPIIGGEVKGEGINGKVCAFGADFQIIRPNELIELEAKYAFETDDGAVVYVENKGLRFGPVDLLQKLKRGEPVDPKLIYFRTVPKFETGAAKYRWLMENLFIGSAARHADRVVIDVHQVL